MPQLNGWLKELQKIQHAPPRDFVVTIGTGSQDLVTKAFQVLVSEGDNILFESPGYVGIIAFLRHQPCNLVGKRRGGGMVLVWSANSNAMCPSWILTENCPPFCLLFRTFY